MGSVTGRVIESFLNNMIYAKDEFCQAEAPADKYERLDQVAGKVEPGSDGLIFLPWFGGTLCPAEDPFARGGFLNLSHSTTRAHMTRSVLEGIAMNYRWLRDPAEKFIGHPMDHWRLSGGGALSEVWVQIMADVVGIPMHQLANPRLVNTTGAAFLAFNRLGCCRWRISRPRCRWRRWCCHARNIARCTRSSTSSSWRVSNNSAPFFMR